MSVISSNEILRSKKFDDVYFSADDGLAETRHVFLDSNHLPNDWQGKSNYVITETGFGTGLNFLAVWSLFKHSALPDQMLDFISIEKYPLQPDLIAEALKPWRDDIGDELDALIDQYPPLMSGVHRLFFDKNVRLTLFFDDIEQALPKIEARVDAWFLDGFRPATNPEMWTQNVFDQMALISKQGTRYATFTAAGDVRRGLEKAGFSVEKIPGFGKKRDMICGQYQGHTV